MLSQSKKICQGLTRMLVVREGVDHRDAGLGGELRDYGVVEGSRHDGVDPALEVVGDVRDALPNS